MSKKSGKGMVVVAVMLAVLLTNCSQSNTSSDPLNSPLPTVAFAVASPSQQPDTDAISAKDVVGWIINAGMVLSGWLFACFQARANRKEKRAEEKRNRLLKKIDKVEACLNAYAELEGLYRFFARYEWCLSKGATVLEPEPQFERAIEALHGTDIRSVIAQTIVEIQTKGKEATDIVSELDATGVLSKEFAELHDKTTRSIKFWIDNKSFDGMTASLEEATTARREFRARLERFAQ